MRSQISVPKRLNKLKLTVSILLLLGVAVGAYAQSNDPEESIFELATLEIMADRAFEQSLGIPADTLLGDLNTTLSLDQALRRLSSVDTFRSIDSFTAHPTTQGVRFRHTATNASSRALLLVDGVPQNDPFGGWIYWNKLPLESIQSLEVFPVGSVPAWGNYSSGGAIQVTTRSPMDSTSRYSIQGGSFGTVKASLLSNSSISESTGISLEGRIFSTDGYKVVRADQRGPVDQASHSDYEYFRLKLAHTINDDWSTALTGQYFSEDRINGTALSPNSTNATDVSWTLTKNTTRGAGFNFVAFYQDRDFQNVFSSVAEDRASERQVLDQYSVPAEAVGAQATWYWEGNGYVNFLAGADFRDAEGGANEFTRNLGNGFTRERQEGGEQSFQGAFVTVQSLPDEDSSLEGTLRWDSWEQSNGFRREFNLETDSQTRDTKYPFRSGDVASFNLRYSRQLDPNWGFASLLYRGFRAPTLNELYRPFRVRNDITESNPALVNEISQGGEISLSYQDEANQFGLALFYYSLDDMVTNVFLHDDVGFDPLCGFVPGGGSCNQRSNVEESNVNGAELTWRWDGNEGVAFLFNYTYSNAEFGKSTLLPILDGKMFPLAPKHKFTSQLNWQSTENLEAMAQILFRSDHFDNVLNTRKIDSSFLLNLGLLYQEPGSSWSFRLQVDNLLDEDVTTAISSSGIFTQSAPINAWASVSFEK